jgi:hypothetical protein
MAALLVAGMSRRNHVNALACLRTTARCDDFGVSKTNTVGVSRIVESIAVVRAKGDGGLQVPDAFVRVFLGVGQVVSQQYTDPHVFRHLLQLLTEDLNHPLLEVLPFPFTPQPLQGSAIWDVSIAGVGHQNFRHVRRKRRGPVLSFVAQSSRSE